MAETICTYVRMYVPVYLYANMYIPVCTYICMYLYVHVYIPVYAHMYVCMYVCMYAYLLAKNQRTDLQNLLPIFHISLTALKAWTIHSDQQKHNTHESVQPTIPKGHLNQQVCYPACNICMSAYACQQHMHVTMCMSHACMSPCACHMHAFHHMHGRFLPTTCPTRSS